jgi:hypothetical protein
MEHLGRTGAVGAFIDHEVETKGSTTPKRSLSVTQSSKSRNGLQQIISSGLRHNEALPQLETLISHRSPSLSSDVDQLLPTLPS